MSQLEQTPIFEAKIKQLQDELAETHSDLQHSRLFGTALLDVLQVTLRERDKAAAAADARTLKLLQVAADEKAALCAHVAQLKQTLQQTVKQAAGDRACLGQELKASAAECARYKDHSDSAQAEVNRMVSSTFRLSPAQLARSKAQEAESTALQQRVCAAEAEMLQQRQEAAGLRVQLEEAGRALEDGRWHAGALREQLHQARAALEQQQQQWVQYLGEAQALMAQREQACLQLVAEAQAVAAQDMMALQASVVCAQQQCTMAVELVHALLVTLGLPLTCVLDMPGGLQLLPTAASPLLAQLVSALREALPLLNRGDSKAVEEVLAGTAVGCRAALEGLSNLPFQDKAAAAVAAAVGSYAEWAE